jgi:hypothetical protein
MHTRLSALTSVALSRVGDFVDREKIFHFIDLQD